MLRKNLVALAVGSTGGFVPSLSPAQSAPEAPVEAPSPGEITVSATRTERRVDDVPASVTVLRAAEIEADGARDIKDAFRNEVDVTVRAAPSRFSLFVGTVFHRPRRQRRDQRARPGRQPGADARRLLMPPAPPGMPR